ncbi:MAG: FAD:protein FMN transferase [Planctomycetota bacterium]|nr:FAD:protein FMN transferase [Planctomycetota bacterium]
MIGALWGLALGAGLAASGQELTRPVMEPALRTSQQAVPAPAQEGELRVQRLQTTVMGTELIMEVWHATEEVARRALAAAERELRRVEDLMTDWRPSPLLDLCAAAGRGPQPVDKELVDVLGLSLEVAELTDGAFDPTCAAVGRLWDWRAEPPLVPTNGDLSQALDGVGWRRLSVDRERSSVSLQPGTQLGLGGIAKGYGVDRAMAVLMAEGVEHALVNAGGDLKALGRLGGSELWEIAIRHPRDRQRIIAAIPLSNSCVATSGDYERFFELDGVRYHHILDPRTGRPATGCMSATVLAPDAALADALATALCVLGPARGLKLIESLPRVEALLVDMDGVVRKSTGLTVRELGEDQAGGSAPGAE